MQPTLYHKTKWLRFLKVEKKTKTVVIEVHNIQQHYLGRIAWFGAWRQYVYESGDGITYNHQCLKDIAEVLTRLNDEHKQEKGKRHESQE